MEILCSEYIIKEFQDFKICLRNPDVKPSLWAVCWGRYCLNKYGRLEPEPSPAFRTDNFIERTRFPLAECITLANKHVKEYSDDPVSKVNTEKNEGSIAAWLGF